MDNAAVIPDFSFQAGVHVHYGETILHLLDGVPKQKDFPLSYTSRYWLLRSGAVNSAM